MFSPEKQEWIDARIKDRQARRKTEFWKLFDPTIPVFDVGTFAEPLADVTRIITNKVERDGPKAFPYSPIPLDTSVILRQLYETYNVISWINSDDFRFGASGYKISYSFVTLPLVRTMIDGFYNATALLDAPERARKFHVSGYFRMSEALHADAIRYGNDPQWQDSLLQKRAEIDEHMRGEQITNEDLANKNNRWPLLSEYLRVTKSDPDTPHKQLLRYLTLGFWKEYSDISHVNYSALLSLYPFIASDCLPHETRDKIEPTALLHISMHIMRSAGLLLCLLTELQHFFKFDDFDIDKRLRKVWMAMIPLYEVRELYDFRYNSILRAPVSE